MKGTRAFYILVVSWLLLVAMTAQAQGGNLLTNPGFEPPFQTVSGEPPRMVAQGWTPWHISGQGTSFSELIQPEYYPASDDTNGLGIPRIRSGNDAQQYFTFFATHAGGVYQRVTGLTSGTQYRFQVYAYVWSTSLDNPETSENPGGVVMQVGIDPTGGTNGESSSIVWSTAGSPQYDAYVPYQVTAAAQGSAVTVFVRSTVSAAVKNTVIYLDDASLTLASTPTTAPSTATPTTPPPTNVFPTAAPATSTTAPATTAPSTTAPATSAPATTAAPTGVSASPTTAPTDTSEPTATNTAAPTVESFTATPTATPTLSPTPAGPTFTPSPSPTVDRVTFPNSIIHTVQSGDTVARLAQLYGSTIDGIISANGLNANGLIYVGQGLIIPVRLLPPATATPVIAQPTQIMVTIAPTQVLPTSVPAQPTTTSYIVRPGDTLYSIAVRFRTTVTTLAQMNNIVNRDLIYYGQRLIVPSGGVGPAPVPTAIVLQPGNPGPTVTPVIIRTYRVQSGDNLFNIALRFNVDLSTLAQYNNILNQNRIFVGQVLVIP